MAKTRIPKDDDEEKIVKENIQKRFKSMFSGKGQPLSNMSIQEEEALKARVANLEAELEKHAISDQQSTLSSDILAQPSSVKQIDEDPAAQASQEQPISGLSKFHAALTKLSTVIITAARQFGRSRIQNRLTALILLTTVPLLIGVTGFITSRAQAEIETHVSRDLEEDNDTLGTIVSTWLELHARTLQEIALLPDIVSMDASRQRPVLQAIASAHPNLFLVQTTDLEGFNVARNDNSELKDYQDRAWFQGAASGDLITFEVLISRTTGKPALNMSTPIRNQSGEIVGVVSMVSELDEISKEVIETEESRGIIYIVDPNNRVVAHPDPSYTDQELRDLTNYAPVAALREGQMGLINFNDENGKAWRAYVSTMDNGWGIISQQPEAEVLAPARQFQRISLILMFVGVGTMLILAWFTIRRTLQPISLLTSTVSAIAAGDLNRVAEVESKDEIGILASTFNSMTAQLRDLITSLEHRVAERTHDLELAAEVGRTISENVEDPSQMLMAAVEMIRERFNLYYTQVYLVDPMGQTITLRAGTGEVGKELLKRGHQLSISTASLNGRAAVEKRSVIVADTKQSSTFLPNPLLPDTRSEMSIPLTVGEKVVGVLDMQSEQPDALNETNLPAFEALAGQLAIALQNAALFTQAEEARATVEAQIRHLTEQGWQDFLDAIDRGQKIGFEFKKSQILRLEPDALLASSQDQNLNIPITVTGTKIGDIHLPVEQDHTWTPNELELIKVTSAQLAQHIENLRLLAQAERYRAEAEQAVQRLTHEGWNSFLQSHKELESSYLFDLTEVKPLAEKSNGHSAYAVKHPMVVGNQMIGELAVDAPDESEETAEVIAAVAEQLSGHIENLRLSELNERHAQREQTLRQITSALRSSNNPTTIMRTAVRELGSIMGRRTVVQLATPQEANQAESAVSNHNESGAPAHQS